jgi:hypothetical protein
MNLPKKLTAVFLVMTLAVFVPRLAWTVFDTYALSHADGKFGAWGGIQFAAFLMGIAAVVSGLVGAIVVAISLFARKSDERFPHVLTALVGGLVLSFASFWIPDLFVYGVGYVIFGEIGMVIVNWGVVCAVVLLLIRATAGRLPPNSRFHSDAREIARAGEAGR